MTRPAVLVLFLVQFFGPLALRRSQSSSTVAQLQPLPSIDPGSVAVSGLSSGGFMAVQLHVAFSKTFRGAGVHAGGPFYCAQGQLGTALSNCMSTGSINVDSLLSYTRNEANKGKLDPLEYLADGRVFIIVGTRDSTVVPAVSRALEDYYKGLLDSSAQIRTVYNISGVHGFFTDSYGNACGSQGSPFINNCGYDAATEMMATILPGWANAPPAQGDLSAYLRSYDQRAYAPFGASSLGDTGYVFIPPQCESGETTCSLLVNLHGCKQTLADIGTVYAEHTGTNEWAMANNGVVLYPQAKISTYNPSNPNGCWDWWGYGSSDYSLNSGPQMVTIHNTVKALCPTCGTGAGPTPSPPTSPAPSPPAPTPGQPTPAPTSSPTAAPTPTPAPSPSVCTHQGDCGLNALTCCCPLAWESYCNNQGLSGNCPTPHCTWA